MVELKDAPKEYNTIIIKNFFLQTLFMGLEVVLIVITSLAVIVALFGQKFWDWCDGK